MQALEMEEVESLVGGNGRKKLNQSRGASRKGGKGEGLASVAIQRNFVTYIIGVAMVVIAVLLYLSSQDAAVTTNVGGTGGVTKPIDPSLSSPAEPEPATSSTDDSSANGEEPAPAPSEESVPEPAPVPATPLPTQDLGTANPKNIYSKFATFIPLVEPPLPDEETAQKLAEQWDKWKFWDGDEDMRPKKDYLAAYPNNDCPGDELPDDAWQVDAVFVNHYLNDADKLITRAMDAIFAEYGHPREGLEPEQLAERMQQFHWEKVDVADGAAGISNRYNRKGNRGNGGWTTKRSEKGLVRRLLHAMMTSDTFTVVMGGHSASAGEGNHFRQNYMMQFHKVMAPIFAHLGVKLITRNVGMGGLGTLHNSMGAGSIYGEEIDLLLWDSGMTENRDNPAMDMFLRQGFIGGKRVPVIWGSGLPFDLLQNYHENADADIGEFGQATDLLPVVENQKQAEKIPWAARYMKCSDDAQELCKEEPKYCARCWDDDREDGVTPSEHQLAVPKGQVGWHPGWRSHQLVGRNLAMAVLQSLQNAVNVWSDHVAAGPPLADELWHVTDYYDNIRTKLMNITDTPCYEYEGRIPTRMCSTPIKALSQYTPRANPEKTGIHAFVKPSPDGYVPINDDKNLYDGPDPPNPCFQIPEGDVDVYAIVAGRRRLSDKDEVSWNYTKPAQFSSVATSATMSPAFSFASNRSLETGIVPGKGWQIFGEPPGYCDGTYNSICNRAGECVLQGNQVGRGAIVGNEFSGWLVVNLKDVKEGIIVLKLHLWHFPKENTITDGWTTVNNETQRLRERRLTESAPGDAASVAVSSTPAEDQRRSLGFRSTDTPEQPDTMVFEYAIDGKITTLPRDKFLETMENLQRVVDTLTILDDPNFTSEPKDVEIAIRMRGCERTCTFGLSHVYWA